MHVDNMDVAAARDRSDSFFKLDEERRSFMDDLLIKLRKQEIELAKLQSRIDHNAFVVVLVDGDGAKFHPDLLRSESGGSEAAGRLHQAVQHYLAQDDTEVLREDVTIIVKVWANVRGLAAALHRDDYIASKSSMTTFTQSFSRSRAAFDFIDVGRGKENADSKMRNMLDFYYNNVQCKKIFFAGCHDSGYIHELKEKETLEQNHRIVLLETTPAESAFSQLRFPMTRFEDVFHSSFLTNQTRPLSATTPTNIPRTPSSTGTRSQDDDEPRTPPTLQSPMSPRPSSTWSYIAQRDSNIEMNSAHNAIVRSNSLPETRTVILYDRNGNRIDSPITRTRRNEKRISYRTKEALIAPLTFCNEHYLANRCKRGISCPRVHHIPLSNAERNILLQIARTSPCASGPQCQDFECYQSHHCPAGERCTRLESCRFYTTRYGNLHYTADRRAVYRLFQGQGEREMIPP